MLKQFVTMVVKEIMMRKWLMIGYSFTAALFVMLYASVYPSIAESADQFTELFEAYPQGFLDALGIEVLNIGTYEGFLGMEHFSIVYPMMVSMLVISMAGMGFAGEIEKGTMGLLLNQPITRIKLFSSKIVAGLFAMVLFSFFAIMLAVPFAWLFGVDVNIGAFWQVMLMSLVFGFSVYGVGVGVATIFSERGFVYMCMGGALLLMYVINVIASLVESWEWLKYFSIFEYYKPMDLLNGLSVEWWPVVLLFVIGVLGLLFGALQFRRRDMMV